MINFFILNTKKELIYLKRYLTNNILELVVFFILLLTLLGGIEFFSDVKSIQSNKRYVIISYLLWYLTLTMTQGVANDILTEANQGTLEQLSLSDFSLEKIYFIKMITNFLIETIFIVILLSAALISTRVSLEFNITNFIIVLPNVVIYLFGIAYIICSLSIIFKNISAFLQVYQFIMMLIIFTPSTQFFLLKFLPLNYIITAYRETLINDGSILKIISIENLLLSFIHSIAILVIGYFLFKKSIVFSKKNGLLGHY